MTRMMTTDAVATQKNAVAADPADNAARPEEAKLLYEYFSSQLKNHGVPTENGIFQADMQVSLINDGPVTFVLER